MYYVEKKRRLHHTCFFVAKLPKQWEMCDKWVGTTLVSLNQAQVHFQNNISFSKKIKLKIMHKKYKLKLFNIVILCKNCLLNL